MNTSRRVFSLTTGESLLGLVVAAFTLWALYQNARSATFPVWFPFTFCNALGLSALCAWRYLRREETCRISRFGYITFAFPIVQTALFVLIYWAGGWSTLLTAGLGIALLAALVAHFVTAGAATGRALYFADHRCEALALPLFLGWIYLASFCINACHLIAY